MYDIFVIYSAKHDQLLYSRETTQHMVQIAEILNIWTLINCTKEVRSLLPVHVYCIVLSYRRTRVLEEVTEGNVFHKPQQVAYISVLVWYYCSWTPTPPTPTPPHIMHVSTTYPGVCDVLMFVSAIDFF